MCARSSSRILSGFSMLLEDSLDSAFQFYLQSQFQLLESLRGWLRACLAIELQNPRQPLESLPGQPQQCPFQLPESLQSQPRECLTDQAPEPVPGLLESLRNQPPNFIEIQVQTPFQLIESLSKGRHGVWLRISYAFSRLASKRFERLEQAAEADCDNIGRTIRQCGSRDEASTECDKTHAEPSPGPFPGPDVARSSIGCTCFEESRNSCALISITYPVGPDFRDSCAKPWFFTHETPLKESRNVPGQSKHVSALFVNLYMFGAFKRDARSPGNSCPSHPMSRIGNVCVPKMKGPSQCPKHSCAEFTLRSPANAMGSNTHEHCCALRWPAVGAVLTQATFNARDCRLSITEYGHICRGIGTSSQ